MMSDNGDNRTQADYDYELLEQAYKELKAQNAELRGVVDKLPKTADGVICELGMEMFAVDTNGKTIRIEFGTNDLWIHPDDHEESWANEEPRRDVQWDLLETCYSTKEAAEAARKDTP